MWKEHEGISFTCWIRFGNKECMHEFWSIGDEMFEFTIDRVDGENCVFADIGMSMFQTWTTGRHKGFEEFCIFGYLLKESKSCAADIFIGMLLVNIVWISQRGQGRWLTDQVISNGITENKIRSNLIWMSSETYTTRIISCLSFPFSSYFGQTSQ